MTLSETDEWIEESYKELERKIKEQEDEFLLLFIDTYLADFYLDDTNLKTTSGNFDKVNQINAKFDEAYDLFIIAFLVWYGNKLIEAGNISLEYFKSIGIAATSKDIAYLSKMIGLSGKTITKGSPLWNLGKMGEMRQRMQDLVMNAVSSGQKYNVLVRNIRPLLKSSKAKRSALSKYYLKYAYNPIMQALNGTSYHLAQKYGLTEFVYAGGLVEKSRHFCIERNGNKYSIEEGKSWNNLDWRGKIDGVDFFIQLGGWNCFHHLEWVNNEEEE